MDKVESLEEQVQALSPDELAQFRAWFQEFDWAGWDAQEERDVRSGRVDGNAVNAPDQENGRPADEGPDPDQVTSIMDLVGQGHGGGGDIAERHDDYLIEAEMATWKRQ